MERISKQTVDELLNSENHPAVTIYIPMHTTASPPHISENQIRFKNLVHKAAEQLDKHGEPHQLSSRLQNTINETHDDLTFWENQSPGLLLCANPDFIRMFSLPVDTQEYVAIDRQFHLAPVLGLLEEDREFYVLEIAQHHPKLYKGDLYGLEEVNLILPSTLTDALNIDENNQKTENQGTAAGPSTQGAAGSPGSGRGWFNGRGGARNPAEEDRMRFFRLIDSHITERTDNKLPMVLAGIDAEIAEYRSISKYPKLLKKSIPGNHHEKTVREMYEPAWEIMRSEVIEPEHMAAVEEYTRLSGANPDRVASDEKQLMTAAEQGRVDKLLATTYRSTSDTVRDTLSDVLRITFPTSNMSAKTLNDIAARVWRMSGKVINLLPEQLPNNPPMVARLRY